MSSEKLNILILHRLGNPKSRSPLFIQHLLFMLKEHEKNHNYLYHDVALDLPEYIQQTPFHAIILDVTFLCARWWPADFPEIRKEYEFVKHSEAVKIAFPNDEYRGSEVLDEWMVDWGVDVVFSVIHDHSKTIYPKYSAFGDVRHAYAGYIYDHLINVKSKPFQERSIDIGYRGSRPPPYFGVIGETKWTIVRDVKAACKGLDLKIDLKCGFDGTFLVGADWLDFISDCKFLLGSNSGTNILDPRREIEDRMLRYMKTKPNASFEEIQLLAPEESRQYDFTAISPRLFEAALLGSCQILVDGRYSDIIRPMEHYIPIRPDASNFKEVLGHMRDRHLVDQMIAACRERILSIDELRCSHRARSIIELIVEFVGKKHVTSRCDLVERVTAQYHREMDKKYRALWRWKALRSRITALIDKSPIVSGLVRSTWSTVKKLVPTH